MNRKESKKEMGKLLKIQLIKIGLPQKALAKTCGVPASIVSEWACGRRDISLKYFIRLPNILNCSLDDLNPIAREIN